MTRITKHLSFSNVVAILALFVALGGSAYAAKKLNGKTIANNSIPAKKLKKNVLTNLDKCPTSAPNKVANTPLCYGPAETPTTWDGAVQQVCPAKSLRAPTVAEAILVMRAVGGGATNLTWTDEVGDLSASARIIVKAPGDPSGQIFSVAPNTNQSVRCVTTATS